MFFLAPPQIGCRGAEPRTPRGSPSPRWLGTRRPWDSSACEPDAVQIRGPARASAYREHAQSQCRERNLGGRRERDQIAADLATCISRIRVSGSGRPQSRVPGDGVPRHVSAVQQSDKPRRVKFGGRQSGYSGHSGTGSMRAETRANRTTQGVARQTSRITLI